jgi:2-oxoglutarate ferredoxin oxidoreductase subunit beta
VHLGDGIGENDLLVHDVHHPQAYYAFQLAHMEDRKGFPTPIGVFRAWENVSRYEDLINDQIADVKARRGLGDLGKLLNTGDTWTVAPQ